MTWNDRRVASIPLQDPGTTTLTNYFTQILLSGMLLGRLVMTLSALIMILLRDTYEVILLHTYCESKKSKPRPFDHKSSV